MKKLTIFFLAMMASFVLSSCSKDSINELLNLGTIQCTNTSSDPYFVDISGPSNQTFILNARGVKSVLVKPGSYTISVTQQSGYILYPTKKNYSGTLSQGKTIYVVFPD